MKHVCLVAVLALSGCAELDRLGAALDAPGTRAASLRIICGLSTAAAIAGTVEDAVAAGDTAVSTTGQIRVATAAACDALGGVVTGSLR